jgi:hypothetical protein
VKVYEDKDTYSHANVYVAGNSVDLSGGDFPKATCAEAYGLGETCSSNGGSGSKGCDALEGYSSGSGDSNKGLKCDAFTEDLCHRTSER